MRTTYIDYIKQKGVENVNVSHMIAETVPAGVGQYPKQQIACPSIIIYYCQE